MVYNAKQFAYPSTLNITKYTSKGLAFTYKLYAVFALNTNNSKKCFTAYVSIDEQWIGYDTNAFIADETHVIKRLKADIGYGRALIFVYQKTSHACESTFPINERDCFKKWNEQEGMLTIPQISWIKPIFASNIRSRIEERIQDEIKRRKAIFREPNVESNETKDESSISVDESEESNEYLNPPPEITIVDMNGSDVSDALPTEDKEDDLVDEIKKQVFLEWGLQCNCNKDETQIFEKYKYLTTLSTASIRTITNPGFYCYINVTIQLLKCIPEIMDYIITKCRRNSFIDRFRNALLMLTEVKDEPYNITEYFPLVPFNKSQDIHEFIIRVITELQYETDTENRDIRGQHADFITDLLSIMYVDDHGINNKDLILEINTNDGKSVNKCITNVFKKTTITDLHKYILVSINRYRYNITSASNEKVFSIVMIDKYIKLHNIRYEVQAIIVHVGINTGHFIIYRKWNNQWICINDDRKYSVEIREVVELIEGDDFIEFGRINNLKDPKINDCAASIRTAVMVLYKQLE